MEGAVAKVVWFFILILVALGLASFAASCYILLHPISVCLPGLEQFMPLLMSGMQFPHYCAERMMGVPLHSEMEHERERTSVAPQTTLDY